MSRVVGILLLVVIRILSDDYPFQPQHQIWYSYVERSVLARSTANDAGSDYSVDSSGPRSYLYSGSLLQETQLSSPACTPLYISPPSKLSSIFFVSRSRDTSPPELRDEAAQPVTARDRKLGESKASVRYGKKDEAHPSPPAGKFCSQNLRFFFPPPPRWSSCLFSSNRF